MGGRTGLQTFPIDEQLVGASEQAVKISIKTLCRDSCLPFKYFAALVKEQGSVDIITYADKWGLKFLHHSPMHRLGISDTSLLADIHRVHICISFQENLLPNSCLQYIFIC